MGPPFESVHLSHFQGPADAVPARIAKRFVFYGDLARFASLTESGRVRQTPIQCRRRPGHKQCRGLLVVRRRDLPAVVEWECPVCEAQGHIAGWEETDADLREFELETGAANLEVTISVPAHAALRDLARIDVSLIELAYGAEVDDTQRPVLLVKAADCQRYGSVILGHSLAESSQRRGGMLVELAAAFSSVSGGSVPGFLEVDPAMSEAFVSALGLEDAVATEFVPERPRPRPKSTRHPEAGPKSFQIKVPLRAVKPPVWRRLIVPSDILLPTLHEVLQAAMGWYDCHLHLFRVRDREFAPPGDFEPIGEDSRDVSLDEIAPRKGSRLIYEYDFGDGWRHDIVVEDVLDSRCSSVRCLKGRRRCPPEDSGGPWGYAELREAIADSTHERHDELSAWIPEDFDPDEFDLIYTDALVRQVKV